MIFDFLFTLKVNNDIINFMVSCNEKRRRIIEFYVAEWIK